MLKSLQAEENARRFLRDVMGQENYNRFIKEGKIEIKSGECTYELAIDGTVINKTKNQKYCIILAPGTPDRDDIPLFDLIAIKYSWLKYRTSIVEHVAHKTYLGIHVGEGERATYHDFVRYMESHGWIRQQLTIDEHNENLVSTHSINAGERGRAVEVRAPAGRSITIMGVQQVLREPRLAHRLYIRLADIQNIEIASDTNIEIVKEGIIGERICVSRLRYWHISLAGNNPCVPVQRRDSDYYTFREGILLHPDESLKVNVIDPDKDIENVKFLLDLDLWARIEYIPTISIGHASNNR